MEEQKVPALIRHRALCAASDQSRDFLLLINIYSVHFVAPCAVLTINTVTNDRKQLILEDTVYSSIRQVFVDEVTYMASVMRKGTFGHFK